MKQGLRIIKILLPLFITWKIALILVTFIGLNYLPLTDRKSDIITEKQNVNYWQQWANWDGLEYLDISKTGYRGYKVAFFPLYPLLIRILSFTGADRLWIGIVLSNFFAFLALLYLYKLALLDYTSQISRKVALCLLVFPTSFFLGAVYSESLFLFLTVSAFYYARQNKWIFAFGLAGLSASTRLVGLTVLASVCLEYYIAQKPQVRSLLQPAFNRILMYSVSVTAFLEALQRLSLKTIPFYIQGVLLLLKDISYFFSLTFIVLFAIKAVIKRRLEVSAKPILFILLGLTPILLFLFYLDLNFRNPLAFLNQYGWGRKITFPWVPVANYLVAFVQNGFTLGESPQVLVELIFTTFLVITFAFSSRKLRPSYLLYFGLSILFIFSSGTFLSVPRLSLVIFPIYLLLANAKNGELFDNYLILSLPLLGLLATLFIGFYWVY